MVCFPAIATTACFVAIIFLDLYNRDWRRIPGHALFGVFAVLLILFICQKASDAIAWILLGSPFVLVFLGYIVSTWLESKPSIPVPASSNPPSPFPSCECCRYAPCRCRMPCWKPKPKPCPKPEPKPKPDNCIKSSLAE